MLTKLNDVTLRFKIVRNVALHIKHIPEIRIMTSFWTNNTVCLQSIVRVNQPKLCARDCRGTAAALTSKPVNSF